MYPKFRNFDMMFIIKVKQINYVTVDLLICDGV